MPNEEDEKYRLTPKGIATVALMQSGLVYDIHDPRIEGFWRLFEQDMRNSEYIVEDDE